LSAMTSMPHLFARMPLALAACLSAAVLGGCGDDLGDCDAQAAKELVYGRNGLVATKGQALMHDSCGNAAFCHSTGAKGDKRFGAPAGLNFDVLPPTDWPEVVDRRDDIWGAVTDGTMPPGDRGKTALGDGDWMFDPQRRKGADKLPALSSREGKAAFRNWLACGAPVVGHTHVPDWAQPPSTDDDGGAENGEAPTWTQVHSEVIAPSCALAGCHNAGGAKGAGMLDMSNLCKARAALLETGPCGEPRVRAGDADSLLLDKIQSEKPRCMGRMPPPLGGLPASSVELVRAWVVAGAKAPECP
jgi:hypothetical protein